MNQANLQLENYFVEELTFRVKPINKGIKTGVELLGSDLNAEVTIGQNKSDPLKKLCRLTIGLDGKSKSLPFEFKITLLGFFGLKEDCPEELREKLLQITAPSILFTATRELLLMVSSRSGIGPVMLPTVVFPGAEAVRPKRTPRKRARKEGESVDLN
ncbi:MAG: protein-export chaperone SecB [Acidobacteria bacterium]|nr:protein-export chaperone SecB [Acidobacteriota bacterium]